MYTTYKKQKKRHYITKKINKKKGGGIKSKLKHFASKVGHAFRRAIPGKNKKSDIHEEIPLLDIEQMQNTEHTARQVQNTEHTATKKKNFFSRVKSKIKRVKSKVKSKIKRFRQRFRKITPERQTRTNLENSNLNSLSNNNNSSSFYHNPFVAPYSANGDHSMIDYRNQNDRMYPLYDSNDIPIRNETIDDHFKKCEYDFYTLLGKDKGNIKIGDNNFKKLQEFQRKVIIDDPTKLSEKQYRDRLKCSNPVDINSSFINYTSSFKPWLEPPPQNEYEDDRKISFCCSDNNKFKLIYTKKPGYYKYHSSYTRPILNAQKIVPGHNYVSPSIDRNIYETVDNNTIYEEPVPVSTNYFSLPRRRSIKRVSSKIPINTVYESLHS